MKSGPRPIAAVLSTTDRAEYLADTLSSLEAAGCDGRFGKYVFYQGDRGRGLLELPGLFGDWIPIQTSPTLDGSFEATIAVLSTTSGSPWCTELLLFEDDLVAAPGAVDVMLAADVEGLAFMSFFDSRWLDPSEGKDNHVLELRPNRDGVTHYGNLALKIPRATLDRFPLLLEDHQRRRRGQQPRNNADVQIAPLLTSDRAVSDTYGVYCPSLVQHIGVRSVCAPELGFEDGYGRVAQNFIAGGDARGLSYRPPRVACMHPRVRTGQPL